MFEQTRAKPPAIMLMEDTIKEMVWLHPSKLGEGMEREGECFAVEVLCFNCDAPMRSDLKGTKSCSGYYGCERCETKGEHHITKGPIHSSADVVPLAKSAVKMTFAKRFVDDGFDAEGKPVKRVQWIRVPKIVKQRSNARSYTWRNPPEQDGNDPASSAAGTSSSSSVVAASTLSPLPASSAGAVVGAEGNNEEKSKPQRKRAQISSALESHATVSQRKRRQQAYDDGYEEGDDEDYETDDVSTIQPPTAADATAADAAAPRPQQKDAAPAAATGGGSVYFPEIGAKPRTDEYWHSYKFQASLEEVISFLIFSSIFIFLK
jgi:hypothetical protein